MLVCTILAISAKTGVDPPKKIYPQNGPMRGPEGNDAAAVTHVVCTNQGGHSAYCLIVLYRTWPGGMKTGNFTTGPTFYRPRPIVGLRTESRHRQQENNAVRHKQPRYVDGNPLFRRPNYSPLLAQRSSAGLSSEQCWRLRTQRLAEASPSRRQVTRGRIVGPFLQEKKDAPLMRPTRSNHNAINPQPSLGLRDTRALQQQQQAATEWF